MYCKYAINNKYFLSTDDCLGLSYVYSRQEARALWSWLWKCTSRTEEESQTKALSVCQFWTLFSGTTQFSLSLLPGPRSLTATGFSILSSCHHSLPLLHFFFLPWPTACIKNDQFSNYHVQNHVGTYRLQSEGLIYALPQKAWWNSGKGLMFKLLLFI